MQSKNTTSPGVTGRCRCGLRQRGWVITVAILISFAVTSLWDGGIALAKKPKDSPKAKRAVRVDKLPPMKFMRGRLARDHRGQWKIQQTMVQFTATSRLVAKDRSGESLTPQDGMEVVLMGYRKGGTFIVRNGLDVTRSNQLDLSVTQTGLAELEHRDQQEGVSSQESAPDPAQEPQ